MNRSSILSIFSTSIILLGCIFVCFLSSFVALSKMQISALRTPFGVLEENGKGLLYHQGDVKSPLLKVTPFDDYVYLANGSKEHLFDLSHASQSKVMHSWEDTFFYHFHHLVSPTQQFAFYISGPEGDVMYHATLFPKQLQITRTVTHTKKVIVAYGNSTIICPDCLLVDKANTVYFSGIYTTNQKLFNASMHHFTPLLIADDLPMNIHTIYIANTAGQKIWGVSGDDLIHYEEPWHLLEVKSVSPVQNVQINL